MDKKVDIIKDADGKSIVIINDLRFKGRRNVEWNIVEDCLKEYIERIIKSGIFLEKPHRYMDLAMTGQIKKWNFGWIWLNY